MKFPVFPEEDLLSGRDFNRRRSPKREKQDWRTQNNQYTNPNAKGDSWNRGGRASAPVDENGLPYERPRWTAPTLNSDPLPTLNCTRCGQPITDVHSALTDNISDGQVHFDCVMEEMSKREALEEGEVLCYIGGGRFGVVHFAGSGERGKKRTFIIKKIFEWENKDKRAEWRGVIADHYSIT
jgi:hypothetical protein